MKIYTTDEMASATLTASTENSQFPATNVQNYQPTLVWSTTGVQASETLTIDLGTATTIDTFIVSSHDFDGTETSVKIQGNATDSWGSPTIDETMTVIVGQPFSKTFTATSLRYWRFIFTKVTSATIRSVGRLWLGNEIDTGSLGDPDYGGAEPITNDRSKRSKSIGGQTYIEVKNQFESFKLDLSKVPESVMNTYVTEFGLMGTSTPYFIVISSQSPLNRLWYVISLNSLKRKVTALTVNFTGIHH